MRLHGPPPVFNDQQDAVEKSAGCWSLLTPLLIVDRGFVGGAVVLFA
jgi:hypothetical protein